MATPEPRLGARHTPSIVVDANLLSPQTRINLPFDLGSPVGVSIEGLAGEVESSCSHPREAMNLVQEEEEEEEEEAAAAAAAAAEDGSSWECLCGSP